MNYTDLKGNIIKVADIRTYLGKHGTLYNNSVVWHQAFLADGIEQEGSGHLQQDFPTSEAAEAFAKMLHDDYQTPFFEAHERAFNARFN